MLPRARPRSRAANTAGGAWDRGTGRGRVRVHPTENGHSLGGRCVSSSRVFMSYVERREARGIPILGAPRPRFVDDSSRPACVCVPRQAWRAVPATKKDTLIASRGRLGHVEGGRRRSRGRSRKLAASKAQQGASNSGANPTEGSLSRQNEPADDDDQLHARRDARRCVLVRSRVAQSR